MSHLSHPQNPSMQREVGHRYKILHASSTAAEAATPAIYISSLLRESSRANGTVPARNQVETVYQNPAEFHDQKLFEKPVKMARPKQTKQTAPPAIIFENETSALQGILFWTLALLIWGACCQIDFPKRDAYDHGGLQFCLYGFSIFLILALAVAIMIHLFPAEMGTKVEKKLSCHLLMVSCAGGFVKLLWGSSVWRDFVSALVLPSYIWLVVLFVVQVSETRGYWKVLKGWMALRLGQISQLLGEKDRQE